MKSLPFIALSLLLPGICGCGESERAGVPNIDDGNTSPTMITDSVSTFISDSGYVRYHVTAPVWKMYDAADEPFWSFSDGLKLKTFDENRNMVSYIECDSAVYWSRLNRWRLDGNVEMINTQRDSFLTQQLFYDIARDKVSTDSFIHIVKADRIMEGYGFESNRNLTAYTVNRPTAIIPMSTIGRKEGGAQESSAHTEAPGSKTDTVQAPVQAARKGRAPLRASERNQGRLPF